MKLCFQKARQVSRLTAFFFGGFLATMLTVGCETIPPVDEYALARTALESAKTVEAAKYSAGYMHKAELAYERAQSLYGDRDYDEAREEFRAARIWAERAENSARMIRFKNGEVL